jgi:hypothetical protein
MHGQMPAAGRHHGFLQERTFFSENSELSPALQLSRFSASLPVAPSAPRGEWSAHRQAFKPRSWSQLGPAHNRRAMGSKTPGRVGLKAVPGWGKDEGGSAGMGASGAAAALGRDATVGEPPSLLQHGLLPFLGAVIHSATVLRPTPCRHWRSDAQEEATASGAKRRPGWRRPGQLPPARAGCCCGRGTRGNGHPAGLWQHRSAGEQPGVGQPRRQPSEGSQQAGGLEGAARLGPTPAGPPGGAASRRCRPQQAGPARGGGASASSRPCSRDLRVAAASADRRPPSRRSSSNSPAAGPAPPQVGGKASGQPLKRGAAASCLPASQAPG